MARCCFPGHVIGLFVLKLEEAVSATPLFCLHLGTRLTKLLEISTKKYLITKRNS